MVIALTLSKIVDHRKNAFSPILNLRPRTLVKSVYQKINFLISQPKHMLWALKRTVSMRRFFRAPKTFVKTDG